MSPRFLPLENGELWDLVGGQETRAVHLLWAPGKKLEEEGRKEVGGEDQCLPHSPSPTPTPTPHPRSTRTSASSQRIREGIKSPTTSSQY